MVASGREARQQVVNNTNPVHVCSQLTAIIISC